MSRFSVKVSFPKHDYSGAIKRAKPKMLDIADMTTEELASNVHRKPESSLKEFMYRAFEGDSNTKEYLKDKMMLKYTDKPKVTRNIAIAKSWDNYSTKKAVDTYLQN